MHNLLRILVVEDNEMLPSPDNVVGLAAMKVFRARGLDYARTTMFSDSSPRQDGSRGYCASSLVHSGVCLELSYEPSRDQGVAR